MEASANVEPASSLLGATYQFIRDHLIPVNTLIAFSVFVVGALDFFRPFAPPSLPVVIYSGTALLALLLLAAGLVNAPSPASVEQSGSPAKPRLRERPWWALGISFLALVSGLGWASYAKASDKGLIADSFGSAAAIQTALIRLQASADSADAQLKIIVARQESITLAGDNCPTLDCAVGMGASEATLKRFIAQGAALPTEPAALGSAINRLSKARNPARLGALATYLDTHALPDINAQAAKVAIHEPLDLQVIAAQLPPELRPRVAEIFTGRNACGMPTLRLTEIAAINGDKSLYEWLVAHGADPSLPNQWCKAGPFASPFTADALRQAFLDVRTEGSKAPP